MDWHKFTLVIYIGSLSLTLSASTPVNSVSAPYKSFDCNISQSGQILHHAQSITVKVLSADFLGSGIMLRKKAAVYTVLTNAHVLQAGDRPYRIQTSDGSIYAANLPQNSSFGENDLALLQFQSTTTIYGVASLASSPKEGDEVFVAGFPATEEGFQNQGLAFTAGKISLVLLKPLEGGYQLGYTNDLKKGMSGGPLLNCQGEVVGVNGMQAYPLWDAPSVFQDGSKADEQLHQMIIRLSWAVPIEKLVQMTPKSTKTKDSPVLNKMLFEK
ncbi:MAG: trypsin-like peptidase domain-containing protein [Nostoc sp. NMS1]|uniref:S1 family peptidase n=1 Tax=unclassified Nostoc TaxID=2593658 RepID=UPI0025FB99F4|nr:MULTISPECIES: serine protease [unclassified Nostoc]MBN3909224.1 trypsin-like peptidase domain-containing protein [Nostoc sp. NMS1]MBN3990330.1 trypsin-like peptidase domain-containing protein [Nostoc sp. NMS2]